MEEGLATEHDCELLGDALPGLLDGGGVANEGGGHLEALGDDVVGDPLDEVGGVPVDDVSTVVSSMETKIHTPLFYAESTELPSEL